MEKISVLGHTADQFQGQGLNPRSLAPRIHALNHFTIVFLSNTTWQVFYGAPKSALRRPRPSSRRGVRGYYEGKGDLSTVTAAMKMLLGEGWRVADRWPQLQHGESNTTFTVSPTSQPKTECSRDTRAGIFLQDADCLTVNIGSGTPDGFAELP